MKNKYYMFCRVCFRDKVKVHFSFYLLTISYQKRIKFFTPWPAKSLRSTALLQSDPQFHCNIYKILHNIQQRYDLIFLNLNQFVLSLHYSKGKTGGETGSKHRRHLNAHIPCNRQGQTYMYTSWNSKVVYGRAITCKKTPQYSYIDVM